MNFELYRFIKGAILSTPACPDGANGVACASCMAEYLAETLELSRFMSDPSASI